MAAIDQIISDFLRDAQYRMVEIANELDELDDFSDPRYEELEQQRLELYLFMDCLYVGMWSIYDGYNHLDWDDYDIQAEIEYLRNRCEMINSPYMTFVGTYPEILACITGDTSGSGLPSGNYGDMIYYNSNGNPITVPLPVIVGMLDSDTPSTFFS